MATSESIIFNGITFRRYPEAKQRAHRVYYSPHAGHRRNGVGFLHQEIWKAAHGPIPEGHHIHHKDGDPLNNDLDNLECLSPKEHLARHPKEWTPERAAHLESIRSLASEWHRSDAGREWHRQHGKESWEEREPVGDTCEHCGKEFDTYFPMWGKFCSNKCKAAARRASGIDDEERVCEQCGNSFTINKYAKSRTCSRSCGRKLAWRRCTGVQPDR